jgi:hypothetical protein
MALAEHDKCEFDELTGVRGLLPWVAMDCGVDSRIEIKPLLDDPLVTCENLTRIGYFLPVIRDCARDSFAGALFTEVADNQKAENHDFARYHLRWVNQLIKNAENQKPDSSPIELGDVASPTLLKEMPLSIVVDIQPTKLGLLDLNTGEAKYFGSGYLRKI